MPKKAVAKKTPKGATLIIVESPTKAKTISKFLGKNYTIHSSYGHMRDLPKGKLGIDVEHDFEPQYVIPTASRKNVTALKKLAKKAEKIILATDEDREGEAISWHLTQALDLGNPKSDPSADGQNPKRIERIVFHEITKSAIQDALEHPREIDLDLVNAQQARRALDRLVGYKLSPFLWKKVFRGLSAGRVQSVTVRLIADREEERGAFQKEEYWSVEALLQPRGITQTDTRNNAESFTATLSRIEEKPVGKMDIKTIEEAEEIKKDLEGAEYAVLSITKKEIKRQPSPPFTTSTLQQEANKKLGFSSKQTMRLAQNLYERGLITYMRTDSVNLSQEALSAVKEWILKSLGEKYATETPRVFKAKSRLAQEAHEAIRPTDASRVPEGLDADEREKKLYGLIWARFVASQLPPALFDATSVEVSAKNEKEYGLRANGTMMKFEGFLRVWKSKISEVELPSLNEREELTPLEIKSAQHFTEPPPRYNEASLVKALEEYGIGRPSTYASTISVIQTRNYVEKDEQRRFKPTETGILVNNLLKEHFPQIVDIQFTANMEEGFDLIADGKEEWHKIIRDFYEPFAKLLAEKYEEVLKATPEILETTDEVCEKCGKPMVVKVGRFGKFLACSGFPECKSTKKLITAENSFGACPECKEGSVIMRRTKTRRFFYGCSRYPECKHASWTKPGVELKD